MDQNTRLIGIGLGGSAIAVLCCFTPVLVVLLGSVGAAAWIGYLDYMLLAALVILIGITAYAWYRRRRGQACCTPDNPGERE
ncbi:MAG TPA: mercury resistance system transport protein MerF [Rhodanobacteraceae bacterium]|nr:mercury resistance system transport protein MerF [Rhodanobacteraceae bacterium]